VLRVLSEAELVEPAGDDARNTPARTAASNRRRPSGLTEFIRSGKEGVSEL